MVDKPAGQGHCTGEEDLVLDKVVARIAFSQGHGEAEEGATLFKAKPSFAICIQHVHELIVKRAMAGCRSQPW
ncbi:hypothetical protein GOP47_0017319 [Adiantum capillus-veneris]|uniref:Uncharacterized protein n=1 Tax=Adiantum capillus-veneris TaxID=13818 RepID=A0A9D4ZBM6_ADICA|nr:hypothetical protein GOP47_0017319 [Adiantum capillus-veneris]